MTTIALPHLPHPTIGPLPPSTTPTLPTNTSLNLSVLRRHNPQITSVLSIAPYAVIYTFNVALQTWEKSGTEGTLFVCQLASSSSTQHATATEMDSAIERYAVLVLNRRGLENFTLELTSEDDVEITPEYVILQAENPNKSSTKLHQHDGAATDDPLITEEEATAHPHRIVYGLWIFAEPPPGSTARMRETNAGVIQECARRAEGSRKAAAAIAAAEAEVEAEQREREAAERQYEQGQYGYGQGGPSYWNFDAPTTTTQQQRQQYGGGMNGGDGVVGDGSGDLLGDLFRRARGLQGHGLGGSGSAG